MMGDDGGTVGELGGNHFNYAHFNHVSRKIFSLCSRVPGTILTYYLGSVTLFCTFSHFPTLFGHSACAVDCYKRGGVIYIALFYT